MELRNIYGQMAGSVESVLVCFGSICASSVVPWHDRLDSTQGLQVSAVKRDGSHRKWHVLFAPRPLCASGRVTAGDVKVTIAVEMFTTHRSLHVSSYNRSICLSLKGIVHICVFFLSYDVTNLYDFLLWNSKGVVNHRFSTQWMVTTVIFNE